MLPFLCKGDTHMGDYTDLLYARPSFIEGMARTLDLGGTLGEYNRSVTPQQANYHALRSDFLAVGQDLTYAFEDATRDLTEGRAMPSPRR